MRPDPIYPDGGQVWLAPCKFDAVDDRPVWTIADGGAFVGNERRTIIDVPAVAGLKEPYVFFRIRWEVALDDGQTETFGRGAVQVVSRTSFRRWVRRRRAIMIDDGCGGAAS